MHTVLCAAGYNLRWLLRAMGRLCLKAPNLRPLLLTLWALFLDEKLLRGCAKSLPARCGC